jgi:hypothetical protein
MKNDPNTDRYVLVYIRYLIRSCEDGGFQVLPIILLNKKAFIYI